jgi:hypothetical protein
VAAAILVVLLLLLLLVVVVVVVVSKEEEEKRTQYLKRKLRVLVVLRAGLLRLEMKFTILAIIIFYYSTLMDNSTLITPDLR